METTPGEEVLWRLLKMTAKDLECCNKNDKVGKFVGLTPILKEARLWVKML